MHTFVRVACKLWQMVSHNTDSQISLGLTEIHPPQPQSAKHQPLKPQAQSVGSSISSKWTRMMCTFLSDFFHLAKGSWDLSITLLEPSCAPRILSSFLPGYRGVLRIGMKPQVFIRSSPGGHLGFLRVVFAIPNKATRKISAWVLVWT